MLKTQRGSWVSMEARKLSGCWIKNWLSTLLFMILPPSKNHVLVMLKGKIDLAASHTVVRDYLAVKQGVHCKWTVLAIELIVRAEESWSPDSVGWIGRVLLVVSGNSLWHELENFLRFQPPSLWLRISFQCTRYQYFAALEPMIPSTTQPFSWFTTSSIGTEFCSWERKVICTGEYGLCWLLDRYCTTCMEY